MPVPVAAPVSPATRVSAAAPVPPTPPAGSPFGPSPFVPTQLGSAQLGSAQLGPVQFGPLPSLVEPKAEPRRRAGLMVALLGAAALVVVLAGLGAFLLLRSPGSAGQPSHPVAVTSVQPSSASPTPSTPSPSTPSPSKPGPSVGGKPTPTRPPADPGAGPTPTTGTIPGIGASMPTFPGR
jgi:hypothetical protein